MTESKAREFWIDEGANGFDLGFVRRWVAEFPHKDSLVNKEHIHVIEKSYATRLLKFVEHKGYCPTKEQSDVGCSCGLNEILKELGEL